MMLCIYAQAIFYNLQVCAYNEEVYGLGWLVHIYFDTAAKGFFFFSGLTSISYLCVCKLFNPLYSLLPTYMVRYVDKMHHRLTLIDLKVYLRLLHYL